MSRLYRVNFVSFFFVDVSSSTVIKAASCKKCFEIGPTLDPSHLSTFQAWSMYNESMQNALAAVEQGGDSILCCREIWYTSFHTS